MLRLHLHLHSLFLSFVLSICHSQWMCACVHYDCSTINKTNKIEIEITNRNQINHTDWMDECIDTARARARARATVTATVSRTNCLILTTEKNVWTFDLHRARLKWKCLLWCKNKMRLRDFFLSSCVWAILTDSYDLQRRQIEQMNILKSSNSNSSSNKHAHAQIDDRPIYVIIIGNQV